jgi:PHP family Zn ribbon phosphoesterase
MELKYTKETVAILNKIVETTKNEEYLGIVHAIDVLSKLDNVLQVSEQIVEEKDKIIETLRSQVRIGEEHIAVLKDTIQVITKP